MLRENVYIADQQVGRQAGVAYLGISSRRLRVPTAVVQALPLAYPICEYGIAIYWESLSDISLPVYTINCAKVYAGEMLGMWMSDSAVIWCMATDGMYKMIYLYVAILLDFRGVFGAWSGFQVLTSQPAYILLLHKVSNYIWR